MQNELKKPSSCLHREQRHLLENPRRLEGIDKTTVLLQSFMEYEVTSL